MNKKIIAIIMVCMLAFSFAGCGSDEEKVAEVMATNVTVTEAKIGNVNKTINYTGEVKATSSASVSAKVSANVKSINVEIGDYVNAGQVLMVLDSTQYSLAYEQACAAYNSALAAQNSAQASYETVTGGNMEQSRIALEQAVASAQSAYDTALDNYNRQKALYDIGAISKVALDGAKTQLDNAKLALDTAKANLELNKNVIVPQTQAGANAGITQAEAGVKQAKVAMDIAANNLANCTITAPIAGYIASKNFTVGQMATPGYEAFSIKNSDMLDVELNVTESVIGSVKEGAKAAITIKSANVTNAEGYVSAVSVAKNDMTGMFTVKVAIPNEEGKIKVGMMADVSLPTETVEGVLTVDFNALTHKNDKYFVYVADGDKAVKRDVEVGITDGLTAEILSGLKEGDKVIVDGKDFLSEKNNKIRIVK